MKKTKLVAVFMLFFLITSSFKAQIWKKIKDKAVQKVENKIDVEVDKTLDKTLEGKQKSKLKKYVFNGQVTITMETESNDKASFNLFFGANKEIVCMQMSTGETNHIYNIITPKKIETFINASGMKIRKTTSAAEFSGYNNLNKIPSKEDLVKTGKTKSILGYTCNEYEYKNDGGIVKAWVTQGNFPIKASYAPVLGMVTNGPLEGFVLELNFSASNGEKSKIYATKIDQNKNLTINLAEYKSLGF
ncbi:DUF4412 domain-containing protein [Polaribacter batillariae]|uniref:DUF4412 domain-containing protein n=1 Tax=Polaribacter batillariae TaxID=2808900 RepID=A0ABX7SSP2_9FLAO|nr:DUF4412 domain-containing protein [Polaribacter batillariae]QTD36561.1 DUF4412 domain-containing protein [Polaribacter batillariae]